MKKRPKRTKRADAREKAALRREQERLLEQLSQVTGRLRENIRMSDPHRELHSFLVLLPPQQLPGRDK